MKLSNEPTEHIIVKASMQSEWDGVDFILMRIPDDFTELKKKIEQAKSFKDDNYFYRLTFWDSPVGWFTCNEEIDIPYNPGWYFVNVTPEEIDTFSTPEQRIDGEHVNFFSNGDMQFCGEGKHTGERLWSDRFSIENFLNQTKK